MVRDREENNDGNTALREIVEWLLLAGLCVLIVDIGGRAAFWAFLSGWVLGWLKGLFVRA